MGSTGVGGDTCDDVCLGMRDNLVAHYKMNDNEDSSTVLDSTSNGNNGVASRNTSISSVAGVSNSTGGSNGALHFNGNPYEDMDYIDIPGIDAINFGTGDFSFFVWIKTEQATTYISSRDGDPGLFHIANVAYDSPIQFYDGGEYIYGSGSWDSLLDNHWHHVGVTRSGGDYIIYVDKVGTARTGSSDFSYSGDLHISGAWPAVAHSNPFGGSMDDFRFYNRVLTQEEINSLYNGGNGTEAE